MQYSKGDRTMKLGKKAIVALSFVVGACLFLTTALADMALSTGYDRLKAAAKHTSAQLEDGLDSFTLESFLTAKIDGILLYESTDIMKVDAVNRVSEMVNKNIRYRDDKTYSWYSYRDETTYAYKGGNDDQLHVYISAENKWHPYSDPFKDMYADDFERIIDALVGNLKDYIMVEEEADGGKVYSGSLSQTQVPTLVNAVLSFMFKQSAYGWYDWNREGELPRISEDIFVSRVSGRASEDANGLLNNLTGEIVLSGADEEGRRHELVINMGMKLSNIGSTTITKPDLTDAIIEHETSAKHSFTEKHIGLYRNDIVIERADGFVKIGERKFEITDVNSETVSGRYDETIEPEYMDAYPYEPLSFEFVTEQRDGITVISYTDEEGITYYVGLSVGWPTHLIHLFPYATMDNAGVLTEEMVYRFDVPFIRVFE
jgi:hypothetical protein